MSATRTHPFSEGMIRVQRDNRWLWGEDPNWTPPAHDDEAEDAEAVRSNDFTPEPPPSAPVDPFEQVSPAMRALHDEARELEQLAENVILSKRAKARLDAIPGEMAALHAEEQAAFESRQAEADEFGRRIDAAFDIEKEALRAYVDARAARMDISHEAMLKGIRAPGTTKIEVLAASDAKWRHLLARLRGHAQPQTAREEVTAES